MIARFGRATIAAMLVIVAAIVAVTASTATTPEHADPIGSSASETIAVGTSAAALPPVDEADNGEATVNRVVRSDEAMATSIGPITWTRVDGDGSSLPRNVTRSVGSALAGDEAEGQQVWRSLDGGITWSAADASSERRVADARWSVRDVDGRRLLFRVTDTGEVPVDVDAAGRAAPQGFRVTEEVASDPADGYPIMLGGRAFLLAVSDVRVPWDQIAGIGGAYRVNVAFGNESIALASGDFHELPVQRFTIRRVPHSRQFELVDLDDSVVWTIDGVGLDRVGTSSPIWAIAGSTTTRWLMWDGDRFDPVAAPWSTADPVDMVAVGNGVLVRGSSLDERTTEFWFTTNGRDWDEIETPGDAPSAGPGPTLRSGSNEAIVTVYRSGGVEHWSSPDGRTFERLADVPGIENRSAGALGWVAADPRSSPRLRVSRDGEVWESVDLAELLHIDRSSWDLSINARMLGSTIYVVAERPDSRVLLIGDIEPPR